MSNEKREIPFSEVLFAIFLFLKLAKIDPVAAWSWWWVTSPLWLPLGLVITIFVVITGLDWIFGRRNADVSFTVLRATPRTPAPPKPTTPERPTPPAPPSVDLITTELEKLHELRISGVLTEGEYVHQRARILGA